MIILAAKAIFKLPRQKRQRVKRVRASNERRCFHFGRTEQTKSNVYRGAYPEPESKGSTHPSAAVLSSERERSWAEKIPRFARNEKKKAAWSNYDRESFYTGRSREAKLFTFPMVSRFRTVAISSSDCFSEMTDFALPRNLSSTSFSLIGLRGSPLAMRAV